jgi:HK97 gp10 family phage protein
VITVQIIGMAAFQAKLSAASKTVREAAQQRLDREADRLVEAIRGAAPVDDGELRDSVRKEATEQQPGVRIEAGGTPETMRPGDDGHVHDVAKSTEYGTRTRAAHPFFWPMIEAHEEAIGRALSEAANDALRDL